MEVLNVVLFYIYNKQNVYNPKPSHKCLKVEMLPEKRERESVCVCVRERERERLWILLT